MNGAVNHREREREQGSQERESGIVLALFTLGNSETEVPNRMTQRCALKPDQFTTK